MARRPVDPATRRKRDVPPPTRAVSPTPVAAIEMAPIWHTVRRLLIVGDVAVIACILASCLLFSIVYICAFIDVSGYHVPNAVRIAQHLNPYWVDSPVDSHWFPAGAETLVAVLVALTGSLNVTNLSGAACFLTLVLLMCRFASLWCD